MEIVDRIEREIVIAAPPERVRELVSVPGWWIGDGDRSKQTVSWAGEVAVVEAPPYGRFTVLPVPGDAPDRIAFRGAEYTTEPLTEGTSTLVEFVVEAQGGGTLLRVVESGFAALYSAAEDNAIAVEGNTVGWQFQLGVAKKECEAAA
ncbi:MAG: polyketide cyclase [Pseudonocardia sp.]|nr:polyketide cyclase [Pseudonocardia sp.]